MTCQDGDDDAGPVTLANPRPAPAAPRRSRPVPLLFLSSATGGGHRAAAAAVAEALDRRYPGQYTTVSCDPLAGPGSAWLPRSIARGYGWLIRYAPWLWGLLYRATDSPLAARLVQRLATRMAGDRVAGAITACRPALIVSFHPFTSQAAIAARDATAPGTRVITMVTDLGPPHATWTGPKTDQIVLAAAVGVPVGSGFLAAPPGPAGRVAQRRRLGHPEATFLVLLVGGAEGAGKLARQATAIVRNLPDVDVAVICGKNRLLHRRLSRLPARYRGRLSVHGFVTNLGGWLRAADLVATKAGPATIAEAACCGAAMVLTCHLPGQERDNVGLVTGAGAGEYWPRVSQLSPGIARLRDDGATLAAMRAAAARLARPDAADTVAALLAGGLPAVPGLDLDLPRSARPLVLADGHGA